MAEPNYGRNPSRPTGDNPPYDTNLPAYPDNPASNGVGSDGTGADPGAYPATDDVGSREWGDGKDINLPGRFGAKPTIGMKDVHKVEASVTVACPVGICYNQWTQFEEFPRFMDGIEQVEQVDDTHLHWVANVAGKRREWDAEILEQEPDKLISWRSTSGTLNNGTVEFTPEGTGCKIRVIMTYGLEDAIERIGDALGILKAKVHGDLKRFKQFIEERQMETGAWRGEVHGGQKREPREPRSRTHRSERRMQDVDSSDASTRFDKPF